jgi:transcriptional regulator with XRE-family HTH domain
MPPLVNPALFPQRLKKARTSADLTLEQAAQVCGLSSRQAYHAYESGRVVPTIELCATMAKALGVDPSWLAGYR